MPPEFSRQMVELVRVGRDLSDLACEFEPSRRTIQNWSDKADRRGGLQQAKSAAADPDLTATERDELVRLLRGNRQLK